MDVANYVKPFKWPVITYGHDGTYIAMMGPQLTAVERAAVEDKVEPYTCVSMCRHRVECRLIHLRTVAVLVKSESPIVLVERFFRKMGEEFILMPGAKRVVLVAAQPTYGRSCFVRSLHFVPVVVALWHAGDMCPALDVNTVQLESERHIEVLFLRNIWKQMERFARSMKMINEALKARLVANEANEKLWAARKEKDYGSRVSSADLVAMNELCGPCAAPPRQIVFLGRQDDDGNVGKIDCIHEYNAVGCVLHCLLRLNKEVWHGVRLLVMVCFSSSMAFAAVARSRGSFANSTCSTVRRNC